VPDPGEEGLDLDEDRFRIRVERVDVGTRQLDQTRTADVLDQVSAVRRAIVAVEPSLDDELGAWMLARTERTSTSRIQR
jgi:hypothetical protein